MKNFLLIALVNLAMLTYATDWSISPTSKNITKGGGSFNITISNPTDNALEYVASADVDWITIAPRNYYATTVNVSIEESGNRIYSRSGYVTVSAYLSGKTHNYVNSMGYRRCYVTQSGQGASFLPSSVSFDGTNSVATITVNVKTGISWELESSANWLALDNISGTGPEVIKLSATVNDTGIARNATIKIYDEGISCASPYSLTITQAPLRPSHSITYVNTMGANNPNPATYIEGESFAFNLLEPIVGYSFAGWMPDCINETNTQDMIVSATWTPVNYYIAYEANGGLGQMNSTSVVYDVEFRLPNNEFTWENHEFLGWARTRDGSVSYNAGEVVSNLTSTANEIVTLYAVWRELLAAPVITPKDGHVFFGNSCEVTIFCPTEGATIYYTTNGNTPKVTSANLYSAPFTIDETTTIRSLAVKGDEKQYSTAVITKSSVDLTLQTALGNVDDVVVTTGGSAQWHAIIDESTTSGLSVRSGEIQDNNESWLQVTVSGEGTIRFFSKTSCEHDDDNTFTWDCLKVFVDGSERLNFRMDGETDWTIRTITFESDASHTVRWVYHKDYSEKDGEDCAWVSGLTWSPIRRQTLYVNAASGSDLADGVTANTAIASLQAAVDRSTDGDTIIVAAGIYGPIKTEGKRITIESESGYKNTIIDGGDEYGCVSTASCYSDWQNTNTVLRGFTLRNGRSMFGGGIVGGTLERCLIINNIAEASLEVTASPNGQGGGAYGSTLRFCTIADNSARGIYDEENSIVGQGGGAYECTIENCIVWNNNADVDADCSNCETTECVISVNPLFANAANGDWRVTSRSPAFVNGIVTAGCDTEIASLTIPELSEEEMLQWIANTLSLRYASDGETFEDYKKRFVARYGSNVVSALSMPTGKNDAFGNAMYVWQDYVAGTDPLNTNSVFMAKIEMVGGAPTVTWDPKLNEADEAKRRYTVYGKSSLDSDEEWHSPTNAYDRFFKVVVEMK